MFEHLIDLDPADFLSEEKASASGLLNAKYETLKFLEELGAIPSSLVADAAQRSAAQEAFVALTQNGSLDAQKLAVATLNTPPAVKHLVGMLTAYDWKFVEQANELRGYTVAGIVEETKHPEARVRLKALELLGKVTEVALFTERLEITKIDLTDEELDKALKEKLGRVINAEYEVSRETLPALGATK